MLLTSGQDSRTINIWIEKPEYSSVDYILSITRNYSWRPYYICRWIIEASSNADKVPLAYHAGKYYNIMNTNVVKPSQQERERIRKNVEKHKK